MTVGTQQDIGTSEDDAYDYYKIALEAYNYYYFTFTQNFQGYVSTFELYKKGSSTVIATRTVEWPTIGNATINDTPVFIEESGDYLIKVISLNEKSAGVPDGNSGFLTIVLDEHNDLNFCGFCNKCGEYQGDEISLNEIITVNLSDTEKAYYRFSDPGDVQLKRIYNTSKMSSNDFKFYRTTGSEGNYEFVCINDVDDANAQFDGTLRDHIASADGWYYIVIESHNGTTIEDGTFSISDEE